MPEPKYLASVIVPVYNTSNYLRKCMESLISQTIEFSKMQILLVNDGSTDNSEEICKEYSEKYDNIYLYSKENEGLSKTRNYGLERADGKYILFLDSDDTFAPDTVKSVTDFFETVYDEVDVVTYRIIQYYNNRPFVVHFRYRTLTKTGVYDLNDPKNRFITQTNINICIKNKFKDNIYFDYSEGFKHEDEKFSCDILRDKMKIGFCSEGEYIYNRSNVDSITSASFSADKTFEGSMKFYEELFASFKGHVPEYYQGIVFNDFRWTMTDKKFLPLHYEGEKWITANKRIDDLLDKMDEETIILHPSVKENQMLYWLKRRRKSHPIVITEKDNISIQCGARVLYNSNRIKLKREDSFIVIDSPIFYFLEKSQYDVFANGERIELFYPDTKDNDINCFMPRIDLSKYDNSDFKIIVNGFEYKMQV